MYLATSIFVWCLAVIFYFSKIPEITDDDMQLQLEASESVVRNADKPLYKQYRLLLAVWGQFMYVGAEGVVPHFHVVKFSGHRNLFHKLPERSSSIY